jgi:hypothetical protein
MKEILDRIFVPSLLGFAAIFLFDYVMHGNRAIAHIPLQLVGGTVFGAVVLAVNNLLSAGSMKFLGALYGGSRDDRKVPSLSKVRAAILREDFNTARDELDNQWGLFPGNGDVLREYERYYNALEAPGAKAEHFDRLLPVLKGEDRAWTLMMLAELYAGGLKDPGKAAICCRRLLQEHPGSIHAKSARLLLEGLKQP